MTAVPLFGGPSLENQLNHAQKMEAIGTLAGGIAHDFNNILAGQIGYLELAKDTSDPDSEIYGYISEVETASFRARDLVAQILAVSRQGDQERKPFKIQPVLREALKLLRKTIPTTIAINHNISPDCRNVLADPSKVHQVVMNLCTNAYHAMHEDGGTLVVQLEETLIDAEAAVRKDLKKGCYARLTVRDTGCGIEENVIRRIFEPYFTTKEIGKGAGLGLATVLGIVKEYDGAITVQSKPDEGSTFEVFLPICIQSRNDSQSSSPDDETAEVRGKGEHILFVDDEKTIVELNRTILKKHGYKITALTSSAKALETFRAYPDRFDLVVTDQTMPGMTGLELAKKILAIRPDIPIILCTGYSGTVNAEDALTAGIRDYLMKPVAKKDLTRKIRFALDDGKTSSIPE